MSRARPLVRPATLADSAALAGLRWDWRVGERGEHASDPADFAARLRAWWSAHPDHLAWLAESGSHPVGMAWLALVARVPGPEHFVRRSGNLQSVYVGPGHRGHGVGAALVEAVVEHARAAGLGYLVVHPSAPSYPLYRRAGFVATPKVLELGLAEPR